MDREKSERLADAVCRANKELVALGLVVGTFGNASGIDREAGIIAIKPSGVDYAVLTPETIVILDLDGRAREGGLNPSSDTRTHVALYKAFPGIGGVVHTHSKNATAWAQSGRALPCLGTTHADYFHGPVPCTALISDSQISRDYEEETAEQIKETFRALDYGEIPAVLVASHGPFTWGTDAMDAVHNSFMLEYCAEMALMTLALNPGAGRGIKRTLQDKHFLRKHGPGAYYGQKGPGGGIP